MNINKIKTFVGFAIKSNSIVYGIDNIELKNIDLILFSSGVSDSTKEKCCQISKKKNVLCYEIDKDIFTDIINNENVKVFAIKNIDLAKAIKSYI